MRHAEEVTFGGGGTARGLDRAAHLRAGDPAGAPGARVLPLWRGKPMVAGDGLGLLPPDHAVLAGATPPVFLGLAGGAPVLAQDMSVWAPAEVAGSVGGFADPSEQVHPEAPVGHVFAELRARMVSLPPLDAEIAATARALVEWHRTHGFCANCGAATVPAMAGWQRDCPSCGRHHFPRTDPVAIMLVTHGDAVLVGRSPGWPERMYSLLAGFVEPGETVEAAVRREVWEEAGVRVGRVGYLASQPWPFPASLMIGCRGEALGTEIRIDPAEIEDAMWVSRDDMAAVFADRHPRMRPPREGAIAGFLLRAWLADRLDQDERGRTG